MSSYEDLLARGRESGFIEQSDINDAIDKKIIDHSKIDQLFNALVSENIEIVDKSSKKSEKAVREKPIVKGVSSSDPLASYLLSVGRINLLTPEQERAIFLEIKQLKLLKQRLKAQQKQSASLEEVEKKLLLRNNVVINANLRLVISIAKRYQNLGLPLLDLIEEGNIGLIEAVHRFEPEKGVRFSTYGTWWVRQAIIKGLTDKSRIIRVPVHVLTRIKDTVRMSGILAQELGREPTLAELASRSNLSYQKLIEILSVAQEPNSLELPVDEENFLKLGDILQDKNSGSPTDQFLLRSLRDVISKVLERLDARERQVIALRFGLKGERPLTLKETGDSLGVTRERVRQIQEKALKKIKGLSIAKELREFI